MTPSSEFARLVEIMAALREPETGCPWDVEQTFQTIKGYTIEEAYEVADAIERNDMEDLCSELGDLLLQPVYHAQMAAEAGEFTIEDVILGVTTKLVRRHPHVFGEAVAKTAGAVNVRWEDIKSQERADRAERRGEEDAPSLLADVPRALPALMRSQKLQKRAAKVGFDWPEIRQVIEKCREELGEAEAAIAAGNEEEIAEEIGDLLFAVVNLARKSGVDAETVLENANQKFVRRFSYVENRCREDGIDPAEAGLERLDGYWNEIRVRDKQT
ncbi:MAG: nucleoside triphosphate pyrophosphohydrolase [Hyphomicrobiaceae bacterium]|nr:nucleoside triphosphate pyrophosphohydrolase [Hyphomicrobiaceae bacterium]MCC0023454.1 nucleoside triphosphate pyrophosphohydrolase [Hyphomicrobiaceae bacterium]